MYRAPVEEIAFTLKHVAGLEADLEAGRFGDLSADLVDAILGEAGRFASEEIAPLNMIGDRERAVWDDREVTMPTGWPELYRSWREGGWNGLSGPEAFGGQNLPTMLNAAAVEMWHGASMAFGLGPLLTMGAIDAIDAHGADALKQTYLEKLVSGEWMATMNLTEAQAGSDLSTLRTRAERREDGTYRIFGQKIYITYGEHDFTDNIVHLVLARLSDAPAGTKGISLFLVPKFLVNADGSLGRRNDAFCSAIEHKIGIHGSPTCTMIYGDGSVDGEEAGAIGWLVGEENRGLACMFTMMNNARLNVGLQGVAIAEAAFQKARDYAGERKQGRAPGSSEAASPIVEHPDVLRNLLTMKALTSAARAISYACAHAIDRAEAAEGDEKQHWHERANLLTPIAKAFSTDVGVDVASIGVQIHGGMGFVEETGAGIYYRDARIAPIYEGTNGIQAIDLVTRKLPLSGGEQVSGYIAELRADVEALRGSNREGLSESAARLAAAIDDLEAATQWMQSARAAGRLDEALAGATPYLRLFGLAAGGAYHARASLADDNASRAALCRFYADNLVGESSSLREKVTGGAASLLAARAALG